MSSAININNINLDYFNQNYRFSYTNKTDVVSLEDSVYSPESAEKDWYRTIDYDDFNMELENIETRENKSSVILDIESQPKELLELFNKVGSKKYKNFVKRNIDGIVFGRNFEKKHSSGLFFEDLGTASSEETSQVISEGRLNKLVYVDYHNSAFNLVEQDTKGDELFTKYSQILSVFSNEIKQAYFMSNGEMKEDATVYSYLKEAITDVQSYVEGGGSLSFVKSSETDIFLTATSLMIDNLDNYISDFGGNDRLVIQYSAMA